MARQPAWPELVQGAASDVEISPSDVRGHRLPAVRFNQWSTVALGALRCARGGRAYYELELRAVGYAILGVAAHKSALGLGGLHESRGMGNDAASWGVNSNKQRYHNGSGEAWGGAWAAGDVIGLAVDLSGEAGRLVVGVNGSFDAPNGEAFGAMRLEEVRPVRPPPPSPLARARW